MRVLTWNLYHGRARPPARRPLLADFARTIAGWPWDVALLQEVPPWWPPVLAGAAGAEHRLVLTSRNSLLPVRRAIARRAPDLIKSNGGGSNAILARAPIRDHRVVALSRLPERRVAHGVLLDAGWVVNLHATLRPKERSRADARRAAEAWEDAGTLILGGDFNVRDAGLRGFVVAGSHRIDHVLARGWSAAAAARLLDAGALSDHRPLLATLSADAGRSRAA